MKNLQAVWTRLAAGQHVVLQEAGVLPVPDPSRLRLAAIDCRKYPGSFAVLDEACRRVLLLQGKAQPSRIDLATHRLRSGLRRHLLGETLESAELDHYQAVLSRAEESTRPPIALALQALDHCDPRSLSLLARLVRARGPRALPIAFLLEAREPTGAAATLLDELHRALPPEAFAGEEAVPGNTPPKQAALESSAPAEQHSVRLDISKLPPTTLQVLRAAATVGAHFESDVIAQLLGLSEVAVLTALQEAVDHGLVIEDRGAGVFRFDAALAQALRAETLPSLALAWHERLAELFGGLVSPLSPSSAAASAQPGDAQQEAKASDVSAGLREAAAAPPAAMEQEAFWEALSSGLAAEGAKAEAAPSDAAQQDAAAPAEAVDRGETVGEQYLAAAQQALRVSSPQAAMMHATRALALAEEVADPERQRQLRMTALLLLGRARWQGLADGQSLGAALAALLACRALLRESDLAELHADLACSIANVQYDIGTLAALQQAVTELRFARDLLLAASRPLDAARLLNDEAAVWAKLGDPARAQALLRGSQNTWSNAVGRHPAARTELAETEHLLARLLLQAPVSTPGHEQDALQLALAHGHAAEELYRALGEAQKVARVWETLARIELRRGDPDRAAGRIEDARQLQAQLGDGIGLARSAAAAADIYAAQREYPRALERLGESITLNVRKGLRAGLEFNWATLEQLEAELPVSLRPLGRELGQRLATALDRAVASRFA